MFDALLMFNAIQASGKNVTVKVMGVAASAAGRTPVAPPDVSALAAARSVLAY